MVGARQRTVRGAAWAAVYVTGMAVAAGAFLGSRWVPLFLGVAVSTFLLHRRRHTPVQGPHRRRVNLAEKHGTPWVDDCAYCLQPATTWDHVVPFSKGGSDERWNMAPACRPCQLSKGDRTPEEWWESKIGTGRLSGTPMPEYWPRSETWVR